MPQATPLSVSCTRSPTTFAGFNDLRCKVENELDLSDEKTKLGLEKVWHAAESSYTDRTILVDENKILFEQNNEKTVRATGKTTVVERAKVMSYQDILDAQQKRSEKENKKAATQRMTLEAFTVPTAMMLSDAEAEKVGAVQEIDTMGLTGFCGVLDFECAGGDVGFAKEVVKKAHNGFRFGRSMGRSIMVWSYISHRHFKQGKGDRFVDNNASIAL